MVPFKRLDVCLRLLILVISVDLFQELAAEKHVGRWLISAVVRSFAKLWLR